MRLELSRRAQADLHDIRDYGAGRYGAARAILYLDVIEQAFRRILDHPEIAAVHPGLGGGVRSLPAGEHRVFYAVGQRILILRVLHKRMDVARHF